MTDDNTHLNGLQLTDNHSNGRIIAIVGLVLGTLVGLATVMRAYIANCQWDSFLSDYEGGIQIESGKEGIQPKHNVKPKFIQIKKPFQKFIRNEIKDKDKNINNVNYNINSEDGLSIGQPDIIETVRADLDDDSAAESTTEESH